MRAQGGEGMRSWRLQPPIFSTSELQIRWNSVQPVAGQEGLFTNQTATYTSFDKLMTLAQDGKTLSIEYGIDRQRVMQTFINGTTTRTKRYFTPLYETVTENGVTKKLHYLTAETGLFAIFASYNGGSTMHYTLKDHQGNLTATICGNTVERLSYDAWGRRRNPVGFGYDNVTHTFDRGYTLHEHYDEFGLINMNGRCYDPLTSSFLSVDAYVQDPTNAQGFNRYAYCSYNPLRYTDPTGWYKQTGANPNPNINLIGTTTYHSDDPCEMLWGRSVHPTQAANPTGFNSTSAGFMVGNGYFGGNIPASHLQAIRAWQNNPCAETSQALENLGITVNVGCILGSLNGVDGFRASNYSWTNADGRAYFAQALDYIGGNEHSYYSMTNKNPDSGRTPSGNTGRTPSDNGSVSRPSSSSSSGTSRPASSSGNGSVSRPSGTSSSSSSGRSGNSGVTRPSSSSSSSGTSSSGSRVGNGSSSSRSSGTSSGSSTRSSSSSSSSRSSSSSSSRSSSSSSSRTGSGAARR